MGELIFLHKNKVPFHFHLWVRCQLQAIEDANLKGDNLTHFLIPRLKREYIKYLVSYICLLKVDAIDLWTVIVPIGYEPGGYIGVF